MAANPNPENINIEDEQLYDWGIENRLDQYYNNQQQAQQQQAQQQQQSSSPNEYEGSGGYVPNNPHLQTPDEAYTPSTYPTHSLPLTPPASSYAPPPAHVGHQHKSPPLPHHGNPENLRVKSAPPPQQTYFSRSISGRRPSLPQVDMDANEIMKVKI